MAQAANVETKDLTECGICLMTIEEPKALPCLHSYCLKCLSKWAEGKSDTIRCPICNQDFPIPPIGVKGFITNFVINTLKDRREMVEQLHAKDARVLCSCCGATDNKAKAYCNNCGGFICEECGSIHQKVLSMQDHKTIPYTDLQTGKVDLKSVRKQQCCKEHEGQVLRFYCKTCGVLICHECTVIDHSATSHSLLNLKHATKEHRSEVQQLMEDCRKVEGMVNDNLKKTNKVQEDLDKSFKKAKVGIQQAADVIKANILAEIEQKVAELNSELTKAAAVNKKQIAAQNESLQMQQTRLQTALQMATEVTETGSDHDLAVVFSSLKDNLDQLRIIKPDTVDSTLGEMEFRANQSVISPVGNLGSLMVGSRKKTQVQLSPVVKQGSKPWKLIKQFGDQGTHRLCHGRHIAVTSNSDFVVTNSNGALVHDLSGNYKYRLDTKQGLKSGQTSKPWNVVVSPDGKIFITHLVSHVNVYDRNGTYTHRFPTKSTSNVSSDAQDTELRGLALDNQGCLLVGEVNQKYISKHRLDGSHVSSIKVKIRPCYIAVTSTDKVIVSNSGYGSRHTVQILDSTGSLLHTVNRPSGVSIWCPCDIYCTAGDEICIANSTDKSAGGGGIYCYCESGQYIGRVTGSNYCRSMVLTENGNKMIVVKSLCVKIFSRQ